MLKDKIAVVIVNLGSPDSYKVPDVRSYLKEFLVDPCVINLPLILRYSLIFGVIAPFRSMHSSNAYAKLWTSRGFPLIYHSKDLLNKVKHSLDPAKDIYLAMRYGNPSFKKLLDRLNDSAYEELLCIPLFPQFASSTTGSIIRILKKKLYGKALYKNTKIILHFHGNEEFIKIWQKKISRYHPVDYDAIVFSFHGTPVRQTESAHPGMSCKSLGCEEDYHEGNSFCYRAACYQTTRSIVGGLNVDPSKVHVSFQSRFGKNWLKPFTNETLMKLAAGGNKKILVISPSFVADCLETKIEIGEEYKSLFEKSGGQVLTLVPSLNSGSGWAEFLASLIRTANSHSVDIAKTNCKTGISEHIRIRRTDGKPV